MSLTWPWALTALLAFPLLLGYRWWMRRRRRRGAVRMSSIALIRTALPGRSLWRRRIPLWLFAIGLGVLPAIDAIAEINPRVAPTGVDLQPGANSTDGQYEPDTIVVLTDGANTQGVDPVTAAKQAAARRVRIYTIGFGTTEPAPF